MSLMLRLIRFVARWLAKRGRCWELRGPDGAVYLRRFVLVGQSPAPESKPSRSLYLHNILSRDPDDGARHTHPWAWSFGIPISGGYRENRVHCHAWGAEEETRWVTSGVNWLNPLDSHEVVAVLPNTWTLFATSKEEPGGWGFIIPGQGYVQHKQAKDAGLIKTSDWVKVDEHGNAIT
jgi:hypothetical protein